jgi:nicotinamide phosphoribosyltransferase
MSEQTYINTMIDNFGTGGKTFSMVGDTYNIFEFCELLGTDPEIKQKIILNGELGGFTVVRPDSGDPAEVVCKCLKILDQYFGHTLNDKGYKVLNNVRVLQGDGITHQTIRSIIFTITMAGYSADNLVFGQGGALLQIVNRDDQKFAMKCSSALVDGKWIDVFKDPITDKGKQSKKGRLHLYNSPNAGWITTNVASEGLEDQLITVFENGKIIKEYTFDEIRANAAI